MRSSLVAIIVALAVTVPVAVSGSLTHGFAQVTTTQLPQGDEFNNDVFAAPFTVKCAQFPFPQTCPDPQGTTTWSLNHDSPGHLRIWTQFGTLLGSSNNARNLVLQPVGPNADYSITTSVTFPAVLVSNSQQLGQTAGILVYQDDDNFIYLGRTYPQGTNNTAPPPQLQFVQETGGTDIISLIPETNVTAFASKTVYLQLIKSGTSYTAAYSYDNTNYLPFPASTTATATPTSTATVTATTTPVTATPTSTPLPATYTATYAHPQVGVFAWGGPNSAVSNNAIPADFDWFRVNNYLTPAPTALPTNTTTPSTLTSTVSHTPTNTGVPTASPTSTLTPTPTATATNTATPTNTPIPTPTPRPRPTTPAAPVVGFKWVSIWYHVVRTGTFQHVEMKATRRGTKGLWVHVIFATGLHLDYYTHTDGNGHWTKEFNIPTDSVSAYSRQAIVTLQLWKARTSAKDFETFTVLR